jgi:hypothetical protein
VVVSHISFDVDRGVVELISPKFLDSFDFVLETSVLLLAEHVLVFVIELFLPVAPVDPKHVAVERVSIRVVYLPAL